MPNSQHRGAFARRLRPKSQLFFARDPNISLSITFSPRTGSRRSREQHPSRRLDSWRHRVFPHGDAHIISNGFPPSILDNGKHLKELFSQGIVLARRGGGGESTLFVCGYMECDRELSKTFLGGLPPVFKVNIRNDQAGQWLENSIKYSAAEASANRAGSDAVLARLSEALFVETMRRYMAELPPQQTGWLAERAIRGGSSTGVYASLSGIPLDDCQSRPTSGSVAISAGRAIPALTGRTSNDISLAMEAAARRAHVDFNQLQRGEISGDVGYESEPAFNRAFKREFGAPPARFRMRAKSAKTVGVR